MVVPRFFRQAQTKEPISVYGDGSQSRCFCYVEVVVEAIMKLMVQAGKYLILAARQK